MQGNTFDKPFSQITLNIKQICFEILKIINNNMSQLIQRQTNLSSNVIPVQ